MTVALILGLYLSPSLIILIALGFKYRRETRSEREQERDAREALYPRSGWWRT